MGPYVHFRLTYDRARTAGLDPDTAETIARSDVEVDALYPARRSLATLSRHFAPTAWLWTAWYQWRAVRQCDPVALGRALHCVQDVYSHGWLGMAHLRFMMGIGRDPDDWEKAPAWERRLIERATERILARFSRRCPRSHGL